MKETSLDILNIVFERGDPMKEWVGFCHNCKKDIFCLDGFLDGFASEDQTLLCFSCEELLKEKEINNE